MHRPRVPSQRKSEEHDDGNNEDAEGIDTKESSRHEKQEQALRSELRQLSFEREHKYESCMHVERQETKHPHTFQIKRTNFPDAEKGEHVEKQHEQHSVGTQKIEIG